MFEVGNSIIIHEMQGEPSYIGRTGVITRIDDAGQLWGTWGGLALIPGVDDFELLPDNV